MGGRIFCPNQRQLSQGSRVNSFFWKVEWQLWKSVSSLQPEQQQVPFWQSNLGLPPKQFGQRGIRPKVAPSAHFKINSSLFPLIDCKFFLSRSFRPWLESFSNLILNYLNFMYSAGVQPLGPEGTAAFFGTALGTALGAAFLGTIFLGAVFLGAAFLGADFLMGVFLTGAALVCGVLVVFLTIVLADLTVVLGWLLVLAEERTLTLAIFFPIKKYYSLKAVNPKQAFLPNHHPLPKTPTAEQTISFCMPGATLAARYSCSGQKDKNDKYQHSLRLWRGPPKSLRVTCFFWLETAGSSNNLWCKGEILLPLLFWGLLPQQVNNSGNPLIGVPLTAKIGGVFCRLAGVKETGFTLKAFFGGRQTVLRIGPICWLVMASGAKSSSRKVALVVCSACSFWGKRGVAGVGSLELSAGSSYSTMKLGVCGGRRGVEGVSLIF